jgi:pimeloyl-ACP methyl ester carboxylesterase
MADFADDLVAFMQAKGVGKATLVGHSMGSFVEQEVALARPELVERAVLIATAARGAGNVALHDYVLEEPVEGSWRRSLEAEGKRYPAEFYELTPLDADPAAQGWMAKN